MTYHERVLAYEAQGMTTSDAQSVVDVENLKAVNQRRGAETLDTTRLIAAAPDLLAMAKRFAQWEDQEMDEDELRHLSSGMHRAIAKAEGAQP